MAGIWHKNFQESDKKEVIDLQANKTQNDSLPAPVVDFGVEQITHEEGPYYEEEVDVEDEDDYEDHDEYDDDDDEKKITMFTKRCTLSEQVDGGWQQVCMGELQIYSHYHDVYAARICVVNDNGETVNNNMIGINTIMEIQGKECWWKAVDWSNPLEIKWRTLKATFSSTAAAEECHSTYLEGIEYAQEIGTIDEIPNEADPLD